MRHLQGQARFANAARTNNGEQTMVAGPEQGVELAHFMGAPDKGGEMSGKRGLDRRLLVLGGWWRIALCGKRCQRCCIFTGADLLIEGAGFSGRRRVQLTGQQLFAFLILALDRAEITGGGMQLHHAAVRGFIQRIQGQPAGGMG